MFEVVNENGVTLIDKNLIFYCDEDDRDLVNVRARSRFLGALSDSNRIYRSIKRRKLGYEPYIVNHLNHLEYDNRKSNLENCSYIGNALDIYGRDRYSILRDCKWCQDLHLLRMTKAITEDEFLYLRLLRLSCFPDVVMNNYYEFKGSMGYTDLFDKFGISVSKKPQEFDEKIFFKSDPKLSGGELYFNGSVFEFANEVKESRLNALYWKYKHKEEDGFPFEKNFVDLSSEEQITWLDELILGEFTEVLCSCKLYSFIYAEFKVVLYDYMQVCKYRARLLYLVKRFYPKVYSEVFTAVESYFTSTLTNDTFTEQPAFYKEHFFRREEVQGKRINFSKFFDDIVSKYKEDSL